MYLQYAKAEIQTTPPPFYCLSTNRIFNLPTMKGLSCWRDDSEMRPASHVHLQAFCSLHGILHHAESHSFEKVDHSWVGFFFSRTCPHACEAPYREEGWNCLCKMKILGTCTVIQKWETQLSLTEIDLPGWECLYHKSGGVEIGNH